MKIIRKIIRWILYVLLVPITFIIVSLILTVITVNRNVGEKATEKTIYLSTNGVHLNIVMPKKEIDSKLLSGIKYKPTENYLSFGWGDEDFYIETETWDDLTLINALRAMFLSTSSLMHVTRYEQKYSDWLEITVNETELKKLNTYLLHSFETDKNGMKIRLENKGYSSKDDFYKSKGSYTIFRNCNSWVNQGFKESGLKSCLWTPFDFGLLNKYE